MVSQAMMKMIDYFGHDERRINHALRVYSFAKTIGELEGLSAEKQFLVEISAIFHDIGVIEAFKKHGNSSGHYQEIEGPAVAQKLMTEVGLDTTVQDRVCFIVGHHHTYEAIDDLDFQILVEADFLVNVCGRDWDLAKFKSIYDQHFKTDAGRQIYTHMYL